MKKVEILTEPELMERLRIDSRVTIQHWRARGMPCLKGPGARSKVLFVWEDVRAWLEENAKTKPGEPRTVDVELPDFLQGKGGGQSD